MKLSTQDKKPYSYLHCDKTIAGKDIMKKHGRTLMEELLQVKKPYVQSRLDYYTPLIERKDVSLILTIFPKNFWSK